LFWLLVFILFNFIVCIFSIENPAVSPPPPEWHEEWREERRAERRPQVQSITLSVYIYVIIYILTVKSTRERYENHKIFHLFPLPGNLHFQIAFVSMHVLFQCQGYSRDRSEMYLCLHSSQPEFIPV
jgi:hypothetical protein